MPIYEGRRPGTWRVVVWANGRSNEWIVEGRKRDAETFSAKKRLELDVGKRVASTRATPTFGEFSSADYEPHAKAHLGDATWRKVRRYQVATLVEHFGKKRLTEISAEDVDRFKLARSATVKPTTVNNELRLLRTILNWAKEERGFDLPPLKFKKLKPKDQGRVRLWTAAQVGGLYEAARVHAPELLPLLVVLVNTGCRKGEALAAEWDWIDLVGGMIRIPANEVWRPKNGLPREVPISDAVRAILSGPRRHERWVFPTRHGGRYAEFPKDLYRRVRDAAGLTGGIHTTRHTFASHFLRAVPDLFLLAQVLGHSHGQVTELYSHLLPEHLAKARNAVNIAPKLAPAPEGEGDASKPSGRARRTPLRGGPAARRNAPSQASAEETMAPTMAAEAEPRRNKPFLRLRH